MLQHLKEKSFSLVRNIFVDYKLLFYILLGVHITLMFIGLDHSISDMHGFRQTQTAITSYYFIHDGFQIDYMTPVLGYPWKIPFEFPIYQMIVSFISKFTHLNLEITGRLVSISAFYGCVFVLLQFQKIIKSFPSYLSASLVLCNPIYIFWTRTFMIESTALLLCISFVYLCIAYFERGNYKLLLWMFLIGAVGILTKVTTFFIGISTVSLILIPEIRTKWNLKKKEISLIAISIFILFVLLFTWTKHCDFTKSTSYIGNKITSSKLNLWNFGSFSQRFEIENWVYLIKNSSYTLAVSIFILIIILSSKKRIIANLPSLKWMGSGLVAPLIFFNLYIVHDYYHYANGLFTLIGISYFITRQKTKKISQNLAISIICLSFWYYHIVYYQTQRINNEYFKELGAFVESKSDIDDVILVLGNDWSSEISYYSKRKCINVPSWMTDSLKASPKNFIEMLKTPNIKHLFLTGYCKEDMSQEYCKEVKTILDLNTISIEEKTKSILFSLKPH